MSERSRLVWRCRRGMKELDLVMLGYLDRHYDNAPAEEKAVFEQILEMQDPLLYGYVIGREQPEDPAVRDVIEKIRTTFAS